jgi:hypothetical protein
MHLSLTLRFSSHLQIAASATVSDDTRALAAFACLFLAMSSVAVACAIVFCCTY